MAPYGVDAVIRWVRSIKRVSSKPKEGEAINPDYYL
jgi:hypothetical protein